MSSTLSESDSPNLKAFLPTSPLQLGWTVLAAAIGYAIVGVWGAVAGLFIIPVLAATVVMMVAVLVLKVVLKQVEDEIDE